MKKETIEKIEDEISKKTIMPNELKETMRKEIFINIIMAIGMILFFILLILGSIDSSKKLRTIDFRVFSIVFLFTAICLFEIAYKKDSGKLAINGIEILIVALVTLFLPYIVFELDSSHQKYFVLAMSLIAVYYIIKSIIIKNRAKTKYEKQESDIKEITKKEERKEDYLDEEIEEDLKENTKNVEKRKSNKTIKNEKKSEKQNEKIEDNSKKKINKKESNALSEKEIKSKKRGRPRKVVESK